MPIHAWGRAGTSSFSVHVGDDVTLDGVVDNFGDYFGQGYCRIAFDPATAVLADNGNSVSISGAGLYRGKVNGVRYFDLPVLAGYVIGKTNTSIVLSKVDGSTLLSASIKTDHYEVSGLETPEN